MKYYSCFSTIFRPNSGILRLLYSEKKSLLKISKERVLHNPLEATNEINGLFLCHPQSSFLKPKVNSVKAQFMYEAFFVVVRLKMPPITLK